MAFGEPADARADIYALACVAWWLLARQEVFARTDEDDIVRAHAQDPVPALRPLVAGWMPPELEALIARCLAKRPQERPDDARALLRELRAIPIPPEHAWTEEQARAWWSKHRPLQDEAPVAAAPSIERMLVPQHDEPVPAIGPEAATLDVRRSERSLRRD
jgi:serine/threonine-protein kinase